MSGKIHRIKKEKDFVTIDNHALRNVKLSWKGKGLHCYLMQLPDDWQINIADLQNRSEDGRDSTAAGLNELIAAGYVTREREVDQKTKKFSGYNYQVYERPEYAKTVNGFSVNGFSVNGKPATSKYESKLLLKEGKIKENTPVSEKETVSLTTFSPGEKIQNLEVIVVEGVGFSLDADSEQTCSGGGADETQQCSTYDLYAALDAKKYKPARDHDSQILQDFVNLGTPEQFEETKRRMTKKANNADRTAQICAEITSPDVLAFFNAIRADWQRWTDYKRREKKGPYKSAETEAVAIGQLFKKVNGDAQSAREAILHSIAQTYTGIWVDANAAKVTTVAADRYAMNDAPKAQTPDEMVREMSFFYRTHIHDGDDGRGLLNAAQKHAQTAYGPDRLNEVVRAFCSHRIGKGLARETFEQQHGAFCLWLQNEKKRELRGQGCQAVFNPSDIRAQQRRANIED